MKTENEICPYCKNEVGPLDKHVINIIADSPSDKKFLLVTCMLIRYYYVEPVVQK